MPYREIYLVMVTGENNNKFYHMVQENQSDETFIVKYGRIDKTSTEQVYDTYKWDNLYNGKIRKGYRDMTSLRAITKSDSSFKDLNPTISGLINKLQSYSNQVVKNNYTIAVGAVTPLQLETAQDTLRIISSIYEELLDMIKLTTTFSNSYIEDINKNLLELYMVLPRQMEKVQWHLINEEMSASHIANLISNEQDILDSLSTQVNIFHVDDKQEQTLLDALGLEVELVTGIIETQSIKDMMTDSKHLFHKLYKVNNTKTRNKYNSNLPGTTAITEQNQKLLFHSSRNANWLSILEKGLLIRPSGAAWTGSMLGDAIYFADRAKKSIGYSSLENSYWAGGNSKEAYLALYNVFLGNSLKLQSGADLHTYRSKLEYNALRSLGYNSIFADASRSGWLYNNEYTVYHPDQCTIEYLIELRN